MFVANLFIKRHIQKYISFNMQLFCPYAGKRSHFTVFFTVDSHVSLWRHTIMQLPKVSDQAERLRLGHGLLARFLWSTRVWRVQPLPRHLPSLLLSIVWKTGHCKDWTVPLWRIQSHGAGRPATRHHSGHQRPCSVLLELSGHRQLQHVPRFFSSIPVFIITDFRYKQIHQERMYQEYSLTRAEAQLKQMEKVLTQQNQCRELELTAMKGEIASLKKVNNSKTIKYFVVCFKVDILLLLQ